MSSALVLLMIPGVGYAYNGIHSPGPRSLMAYLQLLLLRTGSTEVGPLPDMAVCHVSGRCILPVVFLGILVGLLPHRG